MSGRPIGHARVPTDQQVLTVGSGETNVEVDDPSARSGLDWLAVTAGRYGVGCDAGGDGYTDRLRGVPAGCSAVLNETTSRWPRKGPNTVLTAGSSSYRGDPFPRVGSEGYND